jgi:hypothetical protein
MVKMELDKKALADFKRKLDAYSKKTGKSVDQGIVDLSSSVARRLAHTVPPYGITDKAGVDFIASIEAQIDRAWYGANVGAYPSGSMAEAHAAARNSRGVVPKRKFRTFGKFEAKISVAEKEQYKRKKVANAGIAKAGWIAAGEATKAIKKITGVGKWIRRHVKSKSGTAKINRRGISTNVDLVNNVTYISNIQNGSKVASAIKQGYKMSIKRLDHIITGKKRNQTI